MSSLLSAYLDIWPDIHCKEGKVVTSRMERRQLRELEGEMALILLKQLPVAISCLEEEIKSQRNQRRLMVRVEHHKTERSNVAGGD